MAELIDHQERLRREPALRDIRNWPEIPADSIERAKRTGYRANRRAVEMALAGHRYVDIRQATGLHLPQITRLLQRALAGDADLSPPLTRALIPGERLRSPQRQRPLSRISSPAGAAGAFQHLLDTVPGLRDGLDTVIKASLRKGALGENLTPASFHAHFLLLLEHANHPADCYPYTEDSLASETLRAYLHSRTQTLLSDRIAKHQPKRVISVQERPFEFGRQTQLDEYTYDAESAIYLELSGHVEPVRVARFALVVVSDTDTTCRLGFQLAFTQHCSQYDVLTALTGVITPRLPATLVTPGIYVPPGPCFPNQLDEPAYRVAFNTVALDNALAHCARSVESYICERHSATLGLGLPGVPKPRNVIEQAIRMVAKHAKRFKSTSGSHPNDPVREGSRQCKRVPVVTVFAIEEAIYAILARDNRTPKAHLMGNTPLDTCRFMLRERALRLLPEDHRERYSPFVLTKSVRVKWLKDERRAPHLHFYGCRYKGPCLAGLEHQWVTVRFDYRDIRELQVITADGRVAGTVRAPMTWQKFPHGVKTRQYIMRLCRKAKLRMRDPLVEYFWLQLQRKDSKKGSLEMLRLYREYTGMTRPRLPEDDEPPSPSAPSGEDSAEYAQRTAPGTTLPAWSTELANARRKR